MIVALEVPLALNLSRRAESEAAQVAQAQAQAIASAIGSDIAERGELEPDRLQGLLEAYAEQVGGRVVVVDEDGVLAIDSAGTSFVGRVYATAGRPEIVQAVEMNRPASVIRFSDTLGQDILATAVPIFVRGQAEGGAVRITQGLGAVRRNIRQTVIGLVAIGFAGLAAGLLIAVVFARTLSRPLARLAAAAARLGRGDLTARTGGIEGPREVEEVARSFDDMATRLEDTVRSQREFVANASHQLRTPLTGMKLRLEAALGDAECTDGVREQLEAADREVDRLSGIVDRLLVMARQVETAGEHRADLSAAADRAVARWKDRARGAVSSLRVTERGGIAAADEGDLDQILDALIDNALTYAPGEISITASSEDGWAVLAVRDHGPGIAEDEQGRVLERFYRGRDAPPGGSGLGLAIARGIVERWSGSVSIGAAEGGGTRVEVRFPGLDDGSP